MIPAMRLADIQGMVSGAAKLAGLPATSRWSVLNELASRYPGVDVLSGQRWVDAGHIVTSAGVSAGIDMAFHLVDRLEGAEMARSVAHAMEYPWPPQTPITVPVENSAV